MKFSLERPVKIVMLGAGGTGGYAAPHIYRLVHTLPRPVSFLVADGDVVEEKNLVRQNFIRADLGRNKAAVMAERYASAFGMEIAYLPEFVESRQALEPLVTPSAAGNELAILIGAVDNNRSRQMCHEAFMRAKELVYIDSGNGEHTGQVVCGIRRNGRTYYKPVGTKYPDVLAGTDKFPTELSCAEAAVSAPQSVVANVMAATAVLSYLYDILVLGDITVRSVTFSTKTIHMKPETVKRKGRPQKAKAA